MWRVLYALVVMELLLGGGGRLLDIGPATPRMILFAIALLVTIALVFYGRKDRSDTVFAVGLVTAFLLVHLPPVLRGFLEGAPTGDVLGELQPLLYWLIAPFFAFALQSRQQVIRTATMVRSAGVILSVAYLVVLSALALGLVDFLALYAAMQSTSEFFFRGQSFFFYKGFLFLGISLVFFVAMPAKWRMAPALLVGAALVFTLTRGFILATSAAILLMLLANGRARMVLLAVAVVATAMALVWLYLPALDEGLMAQREGSDSVRLRDLVFVLNNLDVTTILFGNGFGALIGDQLNIENTFLWLIWKMGWVGLLFWMLPLALCWQAYARAQRNPQDRPLASAFFFSVVLIYLQTATNPYLNNPIGLSFVLLATFSLRTLARTGAHAVERRTTRRTPSVRHRAALLTLPRAGAPLRPPVP